MHYRLATRTLATLRTVPRGARTISSAAHRPEKAGPLYEQTSGDRPAPTGAHSRAINTAAHRPDTGGPLFDAGESGAELHHPMKGGDKAKASKNEAQKETKGKDGDKKKKMSGSTSFAHLKMLRNEGKD